MDRLVAATGEALVVALPVIFSPTYPAATATPSVLPGKPKAGTNPLIPAGLAVEAAWKAPKPTAWPPEIFLIRQLAADVDQAVPAETYVAPLEN